MYARSGQIKTMDELTIIMRSLGMSPTITELKTYMKDKSGKLAFADFLEIMHTHSKKESIPKELLEAFRGMDTSKKGTIPAKDLWHILVKWGEKLSPREGNVYKKNPPKLKFITTFSVDQIFREANIHPNGQVKYEEFVKIVCAPVPDYY